MSAMVKEVYDAFRSAGVSDEQATAAALAVPPRDELATKTDIAELRTEFAELRMEVKTDIAELRTEFAELRTEVKTDIGELRADTRCDMKDLEMRMTHRFYAAIGLAVAAIKALDFLLG